MLQAKINELGHFGQDATFPQHQGKEVTSKHKELEIKAKPIIDNAKDILEDEAKKRSYSRHAHRTKTTTKTLLFSRFICHLDENTFVHLSPPSFTLLYFFLAFCLSVSF